MENIELLNELAAATHAMVVQAENSEATQDQLFAFGSKLLAMGKIFLTQSGHGWGVPESKNILLVKDAGLLDALKKVIKQRERVDATRPLTEFTHELFVVANNVASDCRYRSPKEPVAAISDATQLAAIAIRMTEIITAQIKEVNNA